MVFGLKEQIVNSVLEKKNTFSNIIDLIRCVYNEYNIRISYDYTWLYQKNFVIENNYNRYASFDRLVCNKLSCNEWCQLFRELLICFNIPSSNITIKSKEYKHKWVEVRLDDFEKDLILIADGTTNYYGYQDILNCKVNDITTGFFLIKKNRIKGSLEDMFHDNIISENDIKKQGEMFRVIDKLIGFYGNPAFDYIKKIIKENNSSQKLFLKLYQFLYTYTHSNSELVINGSDLSRFLKKFLNNTDIIVEFLAFFDNEYLETCCKIVLEDNIIFYCEKKLLMLNSKDYENFERNISFVKRIK